MAVVTSLLARLFCLLSYRFSFIAFCIWNAVCVSKAKTFAGRSQYICPLKEMVKVYADYLRIKLKNVVCWIPVI